ncbi:unnamed protein product [Phytomonas sp. Hart1]|nr:unnamed protein product [Phytomonas sp. Hart1]|eukprot:CCW66524.1 unnamed protein product [Phytomonas sp. isolate Hart1]
MGSAIFNVVNIAEIVKRRVHGLHQITAIGSEIVKDMYEPLEFTKNLDNLEVERKVSTILITLSRTQLDKSNPGYQEPLPEDQVVEQERREPGRNRGERGRRRNSRGGRRDERDGRRDDRDGRRDERSGRRDDRDGRRDDRDGRRGGRGGRRGGRGGRGGANSGADRRDDRRN